MIGNGKTATMAGMYNSVDVNKSVWDSFTTKWNNEKAKHLPMPEDKKNNTLSQHGASILLLDNSETFSTQKLEIIGPNWTVIRKEVYWNSFKLK